MAQRSVGQEVWKTGAWRLYPLMAVYVTCTCSMHGMCRDSTTRILFEGRLLCRLSHCLADEATTVSKLRSFEMPQYV